MSEVNQPQPVVTTAKQSPSSRDKTPKYPKILLPARYAVFSGPIDLDGDDFEFQDDMPRGWESLIGVDNNIDAVIRLCVNLDRKIAWWQIVDLAIFSVIADSESFRVPTVH